MSLRETSLLEVAGAFLASQDPRGDDDPEDGDKGGDVSLSYKQRAKVLREGARLPLPESFRGYQELDEFVSATRARFEAFKAQNNGRAPLGGEPRACLLQVLCACLVDALTPRDPCAAGGERAVLQHLGVRDEAKLRFQDGAAALWTELARERKLRCKLYHAQSIVGMYGLPPSVFEGLASAAAGEAMLSQLAAAAGVA